jgi:hypothetical protein
MARSGTARITSELGNRPRLGPGAASVRTAPGTGLDLKSEI